jgi:hypothetical protein
LQAPLALPYFNDSQGRRLRKEPHMLNNLTLDQLITAFVVFLSVIATVAFIVYLKNRSGNE